MNIEKEVALKTKEQLSKEELECIHRHLKMFISTNWDKKENVLDACIGCNHYCSNDKYACNPWPTFCKLGEIVK